MSDTPYRSRRACQSHRLRSEAASGERSYCGGRLKVFGQIDHSDGARQAGLMMPPTIVLLYGHAKGGTPIMLAAPDSALDLPLRVLVREAGEDAVVSLRPIAPVLLEAGGLA